MRLVPCLRCDRDIPDDAVCCDFCGACIPEIQASHNKAGQVIKTRAEQLAEIDAEIARLDPIWSEERLRLQGLHYRRDRLLARQGDA